MSFNDMGTTAVCWVGVTRDGSGRKAMKLVFWDTAKGHSYCLCMVVYFCKICKSKLFLVLREVSQLV